MEESYDEMNIRLLRSWCLRELNEDLDNVSIRKLLKSLKEAKKEDGSEYGEEWKKMKMYSLVKHYEKLGKPIKMITNAAKKVKDLLNEREENNEQTEREKANYLTYEELNQIRKKYENYNTKEEMYKYLLLSLICTDQAPLRPQIYVSLRITDKKDFDEGVNYLYMGKNMYMYIQDDKVSNAKHKISNEIKISPIMKKILKNSLKEYPREYLFDMWESDKETKLLRFLQKTTGNNFTFNMARSSYSTHWKDENPNATYGEKRKFAESMRHTMDTHDKHYIKIGATLGNLATLEDERKKDWDAKREKATRKQAIMTIDNHKIALLKKPDRVITEEKMYVYDLVIDENGNYELGKKWGAKINHKQYKGLTREQNYLLNNANAKMLKGEPYQMKETTMKANNIKYDEINKKYYV